MTQVRIRQPLTPKQALACCGNIDSRLDPELFKALCDETRVAMLVCLAKCGRGCSVTEIAECCSVDFSVVSRHLALLERAGALTATKEGRTVFYSVRYEHLSQVFRALAAAIDECCPAPAASPRTLSRKQAR